MNMKSLWLFALLFAVPCLGQVGRSIGGWTQVNVVPVCFEGRNNRFGQFVHTGPPRLVAALKLKYKSGTIRCVTNTAHDSHWGCHHYSTFFKFPLNVIITDHHDNIIYPIPKYIKHAAGLWYYMPGVDDLVTNELVFSNYGKPFYLERYRELRVWYGEDLKNWSETDNQGRVCVDVYAKYYT